MLIFNYHVDPACLFKDQQFYKNIAAIMLEEKNVANIVNYDDRSLLKWYINGLDKRKEIIALGSSRVLLVDSSMFPGHSFFNAGAISGCSLEDHMAIYWMFRKKGLVPSFIVFDLDPWLLDQNEHSPRFDSIMEDYFEIVTCLYGETDKNERKNFGLTNKLKTYKSILKKYKELISPAYFQAAFWGWFYSSSENKLKGVQYYPTTDALATVKIKRFDGSIGYDVMYRNTSTAEARLQANTMNGFAFDDLSQACEDKLEKFVDLMQKDGVKLLFFLPEYNPLTYNRLKMSGRAKGIEGAEKFYRELAARKNIRIIGSFDPTPAGLKETDFYDEYHAKEYVIRRYLKQGVGLFKD